MRIKMRITEDLSNFTLEELIKERETYQKFVNDFDEETIPGRHYRERLFEIQEEIYKRLVAESEEDFNEQKERIEKGFDVRVEDDNNKYYHIYLPEDEEYYTVDTYIDDELSETDFLDKEDTLDLLKKLIIII